MATVDGGRILVTVEGRDVNLTQLLQRVQVQMNAGVAAARNYDTSLAALAPTQKRLEAENISYAQSLARNAVASGNFASAQRILASAIAQVTPNTTAAQNALTQLQSITNKMNTTVQQSSGVFSAGAAALTKLIGVYFVASTAAQGFYSIVQAGNEQEKTLTTFKVLSGSTENYQKNLATAREQQRKFGGSLTDTVEGMTEFANLANRTGVDIARLTNLARALAIIDPAQGFKGAGIALKEFFSGNITSLSRRFEIPREVLNSLNKIQDPIRKFQELQTVLEQFGVTQDLINSQSSTAASFERMTGSFQDAKAALGQLIANKGIPEFFASIFRSVESGITVLNNVPAKIRQFQIAVIQAGGSVDVMNGKIQNANSQIGAFAQHIPQISAAQVQFVQMLQKQGTSQEVITSKLEQTSGLMDKLTQQMTTQGAVQETVWNGGKDKVTTYQVALLQLASVNDAGAAAANSYAIAFGQNALTIDQATQLANQYAQQLLNTSTASQTATNSTFELNAALYQQASDSLSASLAGDVLKTTQEQLYNAAIAAIQGTNSLGAAAGILAAQFQLPIDKARELIGLLSQIGQQQHIQLVKENRDDLRNYRANASAPQPLSSDFLADQKKRNDDLRDSEIGLAKARGDNVTALRLLNQVQAQYTKGSAEYNKIEAEKLSLANKGKSGGAPKLNANEKLNNALLAQNDKFNDKEEDEERRHYQRLEKIYEDYQKKLEAQQRKNESSKRSSRFSFYEGNTGKGIDTLKFADEYEKAFRKAQEIAQQGHAKLSEEYLALRQEQIEKERELAQEEADILADKDLSKQEKDAAIEYVEGKKKLLAELQAEQIKQLEEGGDALENERNQQLAEEEDAYSTHADKIQLQADRAMRAKIEASVRAKKAIDDENKSLLDQERIYNSIIAKAGSNGTAVNTPAQGNSIPSSTNTNAVSIVAAQPLPIDIKNAQDVLLVRQADLFLVSDQDAYAAIDTSTGRLESKLVDVVAGLQTNADRITSSVQSLESAIGRIRFPNVVGP
jgi:hypothetical protein